MSRTVIEPFTDVASWTARRANGTASTAITIALDGPVRLRTADGSPLRPTATMRADATALDHRLDFSGTARDLSAADDLVLWVRSNRRADGSASHPFFVRVQLGSAALAVGAQGNTWSRLVPVLNPGAWEHVPMSLRDLPAAVRTAVTTMRFTSIEGAGGDGAAGWQLHLDAVAAVRDEVLVDADSAVQAALHQRVRAGAAMLDAVLVPSATVPNPPHLRITNTGLRALPAAAEAVSNRTDFVGNGFALRRPSVPAEVTYRIDVVTDERAVAATAMSGVLDELLARDVLVVAGRPCRMEVLSATTAPQPGATAAPPVEVLVSTSIRHVAAAVPAIPPFNSVDVEVDHVSA